MSPRVHPAGQRRHLALLPVGASAQEAAAITGALEQFVRDTAAPPAPPSEPDGWALAAREEGSGRGGGELLRDPWINT